MGSSARQTALEILLKIERDAAYSTLTLKDALSGDAGDPRDKSLVTALVYGVVERRLTLDYMLGGCLAKPLKKLSPQVAAILRLGAYQLTFADKIPVSAAVNESVKLAKTNGAAYAAGLVNAVLRKLAATPFTLPPGADAVTRLSLTCSVPEALVSYWIGEYGEAETEAILRAFSAPRPLFLRANPLKTTDEALAAALREAGAAVETTALPHALRVSGAGDLSALPAYREGLFHVQDLSSQTCARILDARPGDTVADLCAAPGGKTFTCAEDMEDRGRLLACDVHPHKIGLIERGAARLGLKSVETVCADARTLAVRGAFADRVLCDAPCSGLGVIGRKPEMKYRPLSSFGDLPALQGELLRTAAALVKPGGVLVYSTCTLRREENEDVCRAFLREAPAFRVSAHAPYRALCRGDFARILPSADGGDGFFIARFEKEKAR